MGGRGREREGEGEEGRGREGCVNRDATCACFQIPQVRTHTDSAGVLAPT